MHLNDNVSAIKSFIALQSREIYLSTATKQQKGLSAKSRFTIWKTETPQVFPVFLRPFHTTAILKCVEIQTIDLCQLSYNNIHIQYKSVISYIFYPKISKNIIEHLQFIFFIILERF